MCVGGGGSNEKAVYSAGKVDAQNVRISCFMTMTYRTPKQHNTAEQNTAEKSRSYSTERDTAVNKNPYSMHMYLDLESLDSTYQNFRDILDVAFRQ